MNTAEQQTSTFDASPEAAIQALLEHDGPVFVDLDETLYLQNSTEDFIDLARPALLALLLLRVLDTVRPWRWTGGHSTRDSWRVRLIWWLFPWTRTRWRRAVPRLAQSFGNRPLAEALRARKSHLVILTAGFHSIVEPLVGALGFSDAQIVATRINSFSDRRLGKLHTAVQALGRDSINSSLFITDSLDDLPVLKICARPMRTTWPQAKYRSALSRIYRPGEYISQVKRRSERYIFRVVLQEDLAFWILSSLALAPHPVFHVLGLTALVASFWTIYERGYVDNDWAARHLESDGKLSDGYWQATVATPSVQPWIWAAAAGALGVYGVCWPHTTILDYAKWLSMLIATYITFKIYNRVDKSTRVGLYAVLQLARSACVFILVPMLPVGAAALSAIILARWVPYYIYRLGGRAWPGTQATLMRLLFFVVIATLLAIAEGPRVLLNWTTPALFFWILFRARTDVMPVLRRIHRLDRPQKR